MCVRLIDMIITGYSPKQLGKAAGQLRDVSILIRRTKMTKPRLMWYYQQLASSSVSWCIAIRNGREVVWEEENTADNFYSSWDELRHLHTLKLGFNSSDKPLARFLGVSCSRRQSCGNSVEVDGSGGVVAVEYRQILPLNLRLENFAVEFGRAAWIVSSIRFFWSWDDWQKKKKKMMDDIMPWKYNRLID